MRVVAAQGWVSCCTTALGVVFGMTFSSMAQDPEQDKVLKVGRLEAKSIVVRSEDGKYEARLGTEGGGFNLRIVENGKTLRMQLGM